MAESNNPSKHFSRLYLAIVLIILGFILISAGGKNVQKQLSSTFANEPIRLTGFNFEDNTFENIPVRIVIPKLKVDLEIAKSEVIAGFWQVFSDKAGWGEGSGIPGKSGNQVIFAHAKENLFLPLNNTDLGTRIYIYTKNLSADGNFSAYEYEVVEIKEVFPNQVETIAPTEDETLTLYTCTGFNDAKRLIVVAKRS